MTTVVEAKRVAEAPDKLWREIGRFGAIGDWHPMVTRVESEGEREGAMRVAEDRTGARHRERLLEIAPERRFYRYRMEATPMPVRDYVGEFEVRDNGDGSSMVVWTAKFNAAAPDAPGAIEAVQTFLKAGLSDLKARYGARR